MDCSDSPGDSLGGECNQDVRELAITEFGGTFDFASATFGTVYTFQRRCCGCRNRRRRRAKVLTVIMMGLGTTNIVTVECSPLSVTNVRFSIREFLPAGGVITEYSVASWTMTAVYVEVVVGPSVTVD